MKVRAMLLELREMNPEAELLNITNGHGFWKIEAEDETVLVKDSRGGPDEAWQNALDEYAEDLARRDGTNAAWYEAAHKWAAEVS